MFDGSYILLVPFSIGCTNISTLQELLAMISDCGYYTMPLKNVTSAVSHG